MNKSIIRRVAGLAAGAAIAVGVVAGGAVESTGISSAMPAPIPGPFDPYIPVPSVNWCPGGGTMTQWGGYCEGVSFSDGTRWNVVWANTPYAGNIYQPMKCVIHTGSPFPPAAGLDGCGRVIGGVGPIGAVGSNG